MAKFRIAGINFDHFHMGDLLRMVHEHPDAELVGICDAQPERMVEATRNFAIPASAVFTDVARCMEQARPDVVILCPAAARHAEYTQLVAPYGVHVLMEKPFAATLAQADAMIAAMPADKLLAVNWPLRWDPGHHRRSSQLQPLRRQSRPALPRGRQDRERAHGSG